VKRVIQFPPEDVDIRPNHPVSLRLRIATGKS